MPLSDTSTLKNHITGICTQICSADNQQTHDDAQPICIERTDHTRNCIVTADVRVHVIKQRQAWPVQKNTKVTEPITFSKSAPVKCRPPTMRQRALLILQSLFAWELATTAFKLTIAPKPSAICVASTISYVAKPLPLSALLQVSRMELASSASRNMW